MCLLCQGKNDIGKNSKACSDRPNKKSTGSDSKWRGQRSRDEREKKKRKNKRGDWLEEKWQS